MNNKHKALAVISMPRLAFTDNIFCMFRAFGPLGIPIMKFVTTAWNRGIHTALATGIRDGYETVITVDYDSVFTQEDVGRLLGYLLHPKVDAVCAMQVFRAKPQILARKDGHYITTPEELDDGELTQLETGHFGLTAIDVRSLMETSMPWFVGDPGPRGDWGDGHADPDIYFWRHWADEGKTLFLANEVVIGQEEVFVVWPGKNLEPVIQHPQDYEAVGKLANVWSGLEVTAT